MKKIAILCEVMVDDDVRPQSVRARINEVFQTETESNKQGAIYWSATSVTIVPMANVERLKR